MPVLGSTSTQTTYHSNIGMSTLVVAADMCMFLHSGFACVAWTWVPTAHVRSGASARPTDATCKLEQTQNGIWGRTFPKWSTRNFWEFRMILLELLCHIYRPDSQWKRFHLCNEKEFFGSWMVMMTTNTFWSELEGSGWYYMQQEFVQVQVGILVSQIRIFTCTQGWHLSSCERSFLHRMCFSLRQS